RRAAILGAVAAHRLGELDVLHQLWMAVEVQDRREPAIEFERFGIASRRGQPPQAQRLLWKGVYEARDGADGAEHDRLHYEIVDAAEQDVAAAAGVHDVGEAAGIVG